MKLELTTLAQHPELIATIAAWFATEWPTFFEDRDPEAYIADHARDELPLALLVLADAEPAGTVALRERSIAARSDLSPWIGGLYVAPAFRGQGIGQLLVVSASRVAWSLGFERIYVGTEVPAVFTSIGWEEIDEIEQSGRMQKILSLDRPEPPPSLYDEVGGEAVVRELVDRFYDLMDEKPEAGEIRAMHGRSLKSSRQKLFDFLSGWLGGPQLYIEKHGHPRLRARHLPFSIGTDARDQWLMCMDQALAETVEDKEARTQIARAFAQMADHMRNRDGA